MFTGLIESVGRLRLLDKKGDTLSLFIESTSIVEGIALGDSIAVNGVCLTVTQYNDHGFYADCSYATVQATNLSQSNHSIVNLERALQVGARLGGHIVSGHVDTTCVLVKKTSHAAYQSFLLQIDPAWMRYIAPKGSVAIDGVSLTVGAVFDDTFELVLIPHSLQHTTLQSARVGRTFNVECDVLAKYIERLLTHTPHTTTDSTSTLTLDTLQRFGF